MPEQKNSSLSTQVFKGTRWYMIMRWSVRGMGIISSAFLARLLIPEDFGLVATVLVLFGLISLLFEFGVNWALIQNSNASEEHYNTAWSLRLSQSVVIALLLGVLSPFIASLYGDVRLELICQLLALGTFIRGFENIGVVKLQKDMQYSSDFIFNIFPKVISTFATIGLAYYYQSYMALVVGTVFNNIFVVITSYCIVRFRPKFSFVKIAEIWGFSQWVLVRNIAEYISGRGDLFFLSIMATAPQLGYYKWATELSYMPITEIQQPFSRALVPGLVKIKHDHGRLVLAYLKSLSIMTLVAVPIALGFGSIAEQLIPLFLGGGDKWLPVVPLIQGLVFFAMISSMYGISNSLLLITGNVKYTAYISWVQALVTILTIYPAFYLAGLEGVAFLRPFIGIIMFIVVSALVQRRCQIHFSQIISVIWRPVTSGLIMFFILVNFSNIWSFDVWVFLIIKIALGALLYASSILILWYFSNKPNTAEQRIIEFIENKLTALYYKIR